MTTTTQDMSIETVATESGAPAPPPDRLALVPTDKDWHFVVVFDFADSTCGTYDRHQSHNSVSFYEYHGHAASYILPTNVDAIKFAAWIAEDIMPILNRIQAGYSSEYDGNNTVAKFTDDAREAKEELGDIFDNNGETRVPELDAENGGLWEAADWLFASKAEVIQENGLTADSTDEELRAAAAAIEDIARNSDVVLDGTYKFLDYLREDMVEAREWSQRNEVPKGN